MSLQPKGGPGAKSESKRIDLADCGCGPVQAGARGHVTSASLFGNSVVPGVNPPSNHYGVVAEIRY